MGSTRASGSLRKPSFRAMGAAAPRRGGDQSGAGRYNGPEMVVGARLTLGGFLVRFAFALLVAGATYNPTRYSYYTWVKSTGFEWRPPTVFVGVVLLIGWAVCLRLTLRSIGGLGLLLANAFLAALYWLVASWGWLPIENVAAISWLGLFSVAAILAVGMSWSHWRRGRATRPG
jgi:hypothetical protein